MQNKVYFTETKPGVFEENSKFKLKSNFEANTVNKEVEAFGWRVRDRINQVIDSTSQKLSNKDKTVLRNLFRAKNDNIVTNETDEKGCSGRRQNRCGV